MQLLSAVTGCQYWVPVLGAFTGCSTERYYSRDLRKDSVTDMQVQGLILELPLATRLTDCFAGVFDQSAPSSVINCARKKQQN